jgi:excinuclease UvrABC nuclease subunit
MPFENQPYPWSRDSVIENAPRRSGVYGLYSALWIYIGEADDLRERYGTLQWRQPAHYEIRADLLRVELIDNRTARESRYRELVRQHGPVCNAGQVSQE